MHVSSMNAIKRSNAPVGRQYGNWAGLATVSIFDDEPEPSGPILGIDPSRCDGNHPRTWDGCCHGCGTRIVPHPTEGKP